MSSPRQDDELLLTHNYDGIQEYDNPMPGWWTFIFVSNIVWAAVYVIGINLDFLPSYEDDLRADMAIQRELEDRAQMAVAPVTAEMLAEAAADEDVVRKGAEVYAMNCATCHGNQGQGLIGPNLTDDAWLVGNGDLMAIHDVIARGTTRGMPGWGMILLQPDLVGVIAYVKSLRGTNPPNPKPAEGTVTDG